MSRIFLLIGGNSRRQQAKISELFSQFKPGQKTENNPDVYMMSNESSIKIEDIRNLEHSLSLKPYLSSPKVALILNADKLTFEAQGALLKLLEEPPGETIVILAVQDVRQLLPTIVSRCEHIFLPSDSSTTLEDEEFEKTQTNILEIRQNGPGKRLKSVEKIITREDALDFCQRQLICWRSILLKEPTEINLKTVIEIQKTIKYLKANVNVRLALDNLILSYPHI